MSLLTTPSLLVASLRRGRKHGSGIQESRLLRLPPELIPEILRHLEDDMPSLSACSLISRTWHIESRRIFFHKLSMNVNGTMYRDDPLPSTRTTFGTEALIHEITFHSGRNFQYSDVEYWSTSLFTIARILAHYPALETVRISTIRWTLRSDPPSSWDWTRPRPSVSLPTVKRVVLFYPYQIPTHSKLCTLLAWFPALEDLEIVKSPGPPQSIVKNITPSGLFFGITVERSLSRDAVVSHSPTRVLLDGFASRVARNLTVRTLVFDIETDKDVRSASLMLHKLRTKLQHLVFRLPASSTLRERGPGALYGGLDLPVFTALRTFDIILHFPEEEVSDEKLIKSWGHMLNLLILVTKAAFDTISKITVVVDPEPATSNLHRFIVFPRPWLELQIMLETLDLDTLTKVDFKVGGIGPGSIFDLEKVGRVLPRIKQRGILQVS